MLDDGIHTLAYFHKDSVTSCKKIQKDCKLKTLKSKKKRLKQIVKRLKKIVTIGKDCDNWKRLW